MVGHHSGKHDVGKRKQETTEQESISFLRAYDFMKNAIEHQEGIRGTENDDGGNDKLNDIDAKQPHHGLVDDIWKPHQESQERVSIHIVSRFPMRDDVISEWVESRDAKLPDEEIEVVVVKCGEIAKVMIDGQRIKHHRQNNGK